MKQMAKVDAKWKAAIEKKKFFLITFAFHWKKTYGTMTSEEFGRRMNNELDAHLARHAIVAPRPEPSSALAVAGPATPIYVAARRENVPPKPKRQRLATEVWGELKDHFKQINSTVPTSAEQGPSSLRPALAPQVARDAQMAANLQATYDDEMPKFTHMANTSSSESEEDELEEKGKGKAKAKLPKSKGKGKEKAMKVKAKKAARLSSNEDEYHPPGDVLPEVSEVVPKESEVPSEDGNDLPATRPHPKRRGQGTGVFFDVPCSLCKAGGRPCEKDAKGGACVGCKRRKTGCSLLPTRNRAAPTRRARQFKSKPVITISDDSDAVVEVPRPKPTRQQRKSAKEAAKRIAMEQYSPPSSMQVQRTKKEAGRRKGLNREADEVVGIIKGKCNLWKSRHFSYINFRFH